MRRTRHRIGFGPLAFLLCLSAGASCSAKRAAETAPSTPEHEIENRARALAASARAHEPKTTELLSLLATEVNGELAGLEHRFKSHTSLVRKIAKGRSSNPDQTVASLTIVDALRYTLVVDDDPSGHYVRATNSTLAALEIRGVTVERVKNYWPRGDNYSGVNAVLRDADGFRWELQFHTTASLKTRDESHSLYAILRDSKLALEQRREVFDKMTPAWKDIAIPQSVLVPGNLHSTEKIILYPRP